MKILASIVSWKNLDEALDIQKIIYQNEHFETAIVENGMPEKSELNSQQKLVHYSDQNGGYAKGHLTNFSRMNLESYSGVLILNTDIKLSAKILDTLVKRVEIEMNNCIFGGPIFNLAESLSLEYAGFPISEENLDFLNKASVHNGEITFPEKQNIQYLVEDLHGCFFYIPAWCIKKFGWMDVEYFLYGEENAYFHRIKNHIDLKVFSELSLIHKNGGSFESENLTLRNIPSYYKTRNTLYNTYKHFGFFRAMKSLNLIFVMKYGVARHIFRLKRFKNFDENYFDYLGRVHFILNKRGKVIDPNDYL